MKIKVLVLSMILSLSSCNKDLDEVVPLEIANDIIVVNAYIKDIRKVYDDEYYAFTYNRAFGNFNIEGEDIFIINMYFEVKQIVFICWHNDNDIDWEVLKEYE